MKRSRLIKLALLGVALTACDQKSPPKEEHKGAPQINGQVFKDEAECQKTYSAEVCHKTFEESKKIHAQTAPKFNSKEECEKLHGVGKCTESPHSSGGGGGIFMPMMMGYMLGNMLGGRPTASPIMAGTAGVAAGASPWASRAPAAPVQRGGFGNASRSYSSAGG